MRDSGRANRTCKDVRGGVDAEGTCLWASERQRSSSKYTELETDSLLYPQ